MIYNPEIKNRFFSSDFGKYASSQPFIFDQIGEKEREFGKDAAQMTREEAIRAVTSLDFDEMGTVSNTISVMSRYVKWCIQERVFPDVNVGFLSISPSDIDASGPIGELCFPSESAFISALASAAPFNVGNPAPPFLALTWLGLDRKTIASLRENEVDLTSRTVSHNGKLLVSGFSDELLSIFREYTGLHESMRNSRGPRTVSRDDSTGGFFKKYITSGSSKTGEEYAVRQLNAAVYLVNRAYVGQGNPPRLVITNVLRSGRLCTLLELERSGVDVFDKANREFVEEASRHIKDYRSILWQYRAFKKAFNL